MSTAILSILALTDNTNAQGAALQGLDRAIHLAIHGRSSGLSETIGALSKGKPSTESIRDALVKALKAIATKCAELSRVAVKDRGPSWEDDATVPMLQGFTLAYEKAIDQAKAVRAEKLAEGKAKKAAEKAEADRLAALEVAHAIDDEAKAESLGQLAKSAAFDPSDVCKTLEARALMGDDAALSAIAALIEHLQSAGVLALDEVAA